MSAEYEPIDLTDDELALWGIPREDWEATADYEGDDDENGPDGYGGWHKMGYLTEDDLQDTNEQNAVMGNVVSVEDYLKVFGERGLIENDGHEIPDAPLLRPGLDDEPWSGLSLWDGYGRLWRYGGILGISNRSGWFLDSQENYRLLAWEDMAPYGPFQVVPDGDPDS